MTEEMIRKEFRRQLKAVEKYSPDSSGILKPKALHRLRSAMLRLSVLLRYGSHGKDKELEPRWMKCRKAMAACRDCDVCCARLKERMRTAGLSNKARRGIRQAIDARKRKARINMQRKLRARKFRGLISDTKNILDDPGKLDLAAIHHDNMIYQRPNEWEPGQFHLIRKRLRVIQYVHDLLVAKEVLDAQQENHNWIRRYQNVLGEYIDGSNTVAILRRLKNVKKRWIEVLMDRESENMQKCRWLIKSMPWPDRVNFSRTVSQESCL